MKSLINKPLNEFPVPNTYVTEKTPSTSQESDKTKLLSNINSTISKIITLEETFNIDLFPESEFLTQKSDLQDTLITLLFELNNLETKQIAPPLSIKDILVSPN